MAQAGILGPPSKSGGLVSYRVEADKRFQQILESARAVSKDLRPALKSIAADFYRSEKAIFQLKSAGGYPDFKGKLIGQTWSKNARPSDIARRTRPYGATPYEWFKVKKLGAGKQYPLLRLTGALEKSITSPNAQGSIYELSPSSIRLGTSIPYGNYHQQDNPDLGDAKIPLRKFLFIGPESSRFTSNPVLTGRLERWLNIMNTFVLRTMGVSADAARGPKGKNG